MKRMMQLAIVVLVMSALDAALMAQTVVNMPAPPKPKTVDSSGTTRTPSGEIVPVTSVSVGDVAMYRYAAGRVSPASTLPRSYRSTPYMGLGYYGYYGGYHGAYFGPPVQFRLNYPFRWSGFCLKVK